MKDVVIAKMLWTVTWGYFSIAAWSGMVLRFSGGVPHGHASIWRFVRSNFVLWFATRVMVVALGGKDVLVMDGWIIDRVGWKCGDKWIADLVVCFFGLYAL